MELSNAEPIKLILFGVIGIVLFSFMMYQIIWNASYGRKIWRESVKQTNLLVEIAKRLDTPDDVVNEILDDVEKPEPVE